MAALNELIQKIENPELRAQIQAAADRLTKQKKFGLVFEEHLPECTPLYDIPVRKGAKVSARNGKANETYTVLKIEDGVATCCDGIRLLRPHSRYCISSREHRCYREDRYRCNPPYLRTGIPEAAEHGSCLLQSTCAKAHYPAHCTPLPRAASRDR